MAQKERPQYPIASVDNALRLLLVFRDEDEIRLSAASELLGVANSTAHRLLAMLAYHDFVRQDPDSKAYRAGSALTEVGLAVVRRMDTRQVFRPLLEELSQITGETIHSAVLEGIDVRYLDAVESHRALRVAARTGMVLPAHCSSVGKALLAQLPSAELRARYPRQKLKALTSGSLTSRTHLEEALALTREQGYAVNVEESEEGVVAVGIAVTSELGPQVVGISCSVPVSRIDRSEIPALAATVRATAERHTLIAPLPHPEADADTTTR